MSKLQEIKLPDVGGEEVDIIDICVQNGQDINEEDAIITVETEKASMDIPATSACKIIELKVKIGDKIREGSVICTIQNASLSIGTEEEKIEVLANDISEQKETVVKAETPISASNSKTILSDVFVPDIGEDGEVDVIEILVKVGDSVKNEDGLITLETDKATMDVPAPFDGIIKELLIAEGGKVKSGTLIARIEHISTTSVPSNTPAVKSEDIKESLSKKQHENLQTNEVVILASNDKAHASPSIRRLAREFGVDLSLVKGSGRKNRIIEQDVKTYVKQTLANPTIQANTGSADNSLNLNLPKAKSIDFTKFGEIEIKELTKIQKISGPSLHRNWVSIPHITQFDEADITSLEEFRKAQNALALKMKSTIKISPLIFIIQAVAKALELHPTFNSSLSDDQQSIVLKKYINVAIAVDTPNGLVVPVIKDANKKGVKELAQELAIISTKARDGKLKIQDMQGACFTISSLGGIGGTAFTPIINAPEVAILGVSKAQIKPTWNGSEFVPKLILPLSLSYDHRVIDGAEGARFSATVSNILSDIRLLSM